MHARSCSMVTLLLATAAIATRPVNGIPASATWHVDAGAGGPLEDGSPGHPFDTIQEGIDAASNGDTVLVADGTYTGPGNRDLDYGGRLITVRGASGDPDLCVIDAEDDGRGFVFQSGETAAARLEAISVVNGAPDEGDGGALRIIGASPTVVDCVFESCEPAFLRDGGGVLVDGGAPSFIGCLFRDNEAPDGLGGGAASVDANPHFIDCRFENNLSVDLDARGGAVHVDGGLVTMTECTFEDNLANGFCCGQGGAIYNGAPIFGDGELVVDRCTFRRNRTGSSTCAGTDCAQGGAIWGAVTATDSIFIGNEASGGSALSGQPHRGGAIDGSGALIGCVFIGNEANHFSVSAGGGALSGDFDVDGCVFVANRVEGPGSTGSAISGGGTVDNSIFWANGPGLLFGAVVVSSSLVEQDPGFVEDPAPGPDATWGTDDDVGDVRLGPGSPAIDAGDNTAVPAGVTTDLDGLPRFVDDANTPNTGVPDCVNPPVDIGAHEFAGATPLLTDVDQNGVVDVDDVIAVILAFGPCPGCPTDVDGSGTVDIDDLIEVILEFDCTILTCIIDCNDNGIADNVDIYTCVSADANLDGIPDECD